MLPFKVAFPPKYWQVQQYLLDFEIVLISYPQKTNFQSDRKIYIENISFDFVPN